MRARARQADAHLGARVDGVLDRDLDGVGGDLGGLAAQHRRAQAVGEQHLRAHVRALPHRQLQEPRRVYPYHRLAASALGFAIIDGQGVRGIEQQEDSWLRGMAPENNA